MRPPVPPGYRAPWSASQTGTHHRGSAAPIGGSARVLPGTVFITYCDGSSQCSAWLPWDDSWDERQSYPCAMCAFCASACGIRAGRTLLASPRSSFSPPVRAEGATCALGDRARGRARRAVASESGVPGIKALMIREAASSSWALDPPGPGSAALAIGEHLPHAIGPLLYPVAGSDAQTRTPIKGSKQESHSESQREPASGDSQPHPATIWAVQVPSQPFGTTSSDARKVTGGQGVAGSNPAVPTGSRGFFECIYISREPAEEPISL
jgi:hypothetical protein